MIDPEMQSYIDGKLSDAQFNVAKVPYHIHSGTDSPRIDTKDLVGGSGGLPTPPGDATQFLNGAATPAFAQVTDVDLSLSNTTANDVNFARHGFTPIAPNDATKFLRGDATWNVPGATAINIKCGNVTVAAPQDGVVTTIAHGLGRVPVVVRINALGLVSTNSVINQPMSWAVYNVVDSIARCLYVGTYFDGAITNTTGGVDNFYVVYLPKVTGTNSYTSTATIAVNGTNIVLTWEAVSGIDVAVSLSWEVQ